MVLKASSRETTHCKYVRYIKQWQAYAKDFASIEIHHVLGFLIALSDKGEAYFTINCTKCVVATILHVSIYHEACKCNS